MKGKLIALLIGAVLTGCTAIRPIAEVSHTSHVTQHFGSNQGNAGWNVFSAGVRIRPGFGVTMDIVDGYSVEPVDGRHEVFQATLLWEIGHHDDP